MELGLKGKVAIVTGGTEGIGRAAAFMFAREGAKIAICGRKTETVSKVVSDIEAAGGDAYGMATDIRKSEDIDRFMTAVLDKFGRIDILVNNAGTSQRGNFLEVDDATWAADLDLKIFGAIRCSRIAIPHMRKQGGGRIINVTSTGGKQPPASSMPTTLSRAAGLALTKALSKEFAPDNILVNTVCIGKVKSGQHERRIVRTGTTPEAYYAKAGKDIPMGRVGETDEAANIIVFLASAAASYVTGTSINIDGGVSGVL